MRAWAAATRRSHSRASAKPPAIAGPFKNATVGVRHRARVSNRRVLVSTIRWRLAASPPNWVTSIPEQNAVPAPVRTIAPVSSPP